MALLLVFLSGVANVGLLGLFVAGDGLGLVVRQLVQWIQTVVAVGLVERNQIAHF